MRGWRQYAAWLTSVILLVVMPGCGQPAANTKTATKPAPQQVAAPAEKAAKAAEDVIVLPPGSPCPAFGQPNYLVVYEGQDEPPNPFLIVNYEKDMWRLWEAKSEIELRSDKKVNSPVTATLTPGERIRVLEAELSVRPAKAIVKKEHTWVFPNGKQRVVAQGDNIYILYKFYEETYRVWHRGAVLYANVSGVKGTDWHRPGLYKEEWGEIVEEGDFELCMKVEGGTGKTGWMVWERGKLTLKR